MPDLTPLSDNRKEHFLNGEVLEPLQTRREYYYAGREGELPPHQPTREELFIQKYRGGGGGDVTVVPLSVTENGTYSEEGKAYSPVSVNVPLPQNAYLLKSVNTPTPIASFSDGEEMVMPSLKVAIEPQQEGSGDPSPTNIRPFSGWDKVDINVSGVNVWDEEWRIDGAQFKAKNLIPVKPNTSYYFKSPLSAYSAFKYDINGTSLGAIVLPENAVFTTDSKTYYIWFSLSVSEYGTTYNNDISINYPSTDTSYHAYNGHTYSIPFTVNGETKTIYGGYVEVINGKVKAVATHELQPLTNWNWARESAGGGNYRFRSKSRVWDIYERASSNCTSSVFTINRSPISGAKVDNTLWVHTDGLVYVYCDSYTDATEFKEFVKDTQLLLPLITPIEYDLADVSISTLLGSNNVWGDCGQIKEGSYFSKGEEE